MPLTKSQFLTFLDSPLHLWADVHGKLDDRKFSVYDQLIAKQGYEVEALAKQFLEQKVRREYPAGSTVSFQYQLIDGNYQAKIDALVHDVQNDTYDLYEIKSSTKLDKQHKYDATFQHLIAKSALPVHTTFVVHVNSEYVKDGEIDLDEFFSVNDMSEIVSKLEDEVFRLRAQALEVMNLTEPPLDVHCSKPKTCPCQQLCHPNISQYPVYDLSWWKVGQYEKLVANGYHNLNEIPETEELNPKQILQIRSIKTGQPIIDQIGIQRELGNLVFPLYFLDYETFGPAIPVFDGYKPYQHIVFQYSLHVMADKNATQLQHFEFLMTEKTEPSEQLVSALLQVIGSTGSVIVWNKNFECKRNEELAVLQPMYADELLSINERVFDLMDIFMDGLYVDCRFHGSASIKKVLPILVPDLSYSGMEIGEGATAMTKWWEMVNGEGTKNKNFGIKKQSIAWALLKYCELDTLAMVEIWKKLHVILAFAGKQS